MRITKEINWPQEVALSNGSGYSDVMGQEFFNWLKTKNNLPLERQLLGQT